MNAEVEFPKKLDESILENNKHCRRIFNKLVYICFRFSDQWCSSWLDDIELALYERYLRYTQNKDYTWSFHELDLFDDEEVFEIIEKAIKLNIFVIENKNYEKIPVSFKEFKEYYSSLNIINIEHYFSD